MRTNTSWAFIGNAAYAGCQWLVFVLLVRSLGPAEVGVFAYWIAVTGPVFVLANVRLRNLLVAEAGSPGDFSDYLTARVLTTSGAVVFSLLIGVVAWPGTRSLIVLMLIAAAKACDAMSDICHGLFQRDLQMRKAAIGLMVNGFISVTLVAAILLLRPSLTGATAAYAAGSGLALLLWDLPRVTSSARFFAWGTDGTRRAAVKRLIIKAFPLGLSSAIGSLQVNLPRFVVGSVLGPASLGVFAALSYLPVLGNLVVNAIAQAALPILATDLRTAPARYRERLLWLVAAGAVVGAGGLAVTALAGRPLLEWMYGRAYADHDALLLWLMTGAAVSYVFVFLGTATVARLRFGSQCLISLAGLAIVTATIGPLVTYKGMTGAAWSLIAGGLVEGCAYLVLTARHLSTATAHPVMAHGLVEGVRS